MAILLGLAGRLGTEEADAATAPTTLSGEFNAGSGAHTERAAPTADKIIKQSR